MYKRDDDDDDVIKFVAYSCTTREDNVQYTVFCRNSSTFDSALYCIYCSLTCQTEQAYSRYEANSHGPENAPKYFETQKYLFFWRGAQPLPRLLINGEGGTNGEGCAPLPIRVPVYSRRIRLLYSCAFGARLGSFWIRGPASII